METWELNEKKKEYLNGYRDAKRREKRILEQIQQLRLDTMFPCLQGDGMLSRKLNDALSSRLFYAHFDSHRDISHFKSSCFCELFF